MAATALRRPAIAVPDGVRRALPGAIAILLVAGVLGATDRESVLVNGVLAGASFSLLAIGLTLVHRSSGIFNFAQGELGTVAIFAAFLAHGARLPILGVRLGIGWAVLVAIVVGVGFGLLVERVVIRPLRAAPRVLLLVATAGVALLSIAVQIWIGEAQPRQLAPILPKQGRFRILDVAVADQQLLTLAVLAVATTALGLFLTRTDLGLAVLAASQDATAARLVGISTSRLSSLVWAIAGLLGALAGVLASGSFTPGFLTSNGLIFAFTGAVLGGIASIPGAVVGGLAIGIAQALGASLPSSIKGGSALFTFLSLTLVLVLRPQGLLGGKR